MAKICVPALIVSGVAKVTMHDTRGRKSVLAYLSHGDAFGEISVFTGVNCTADVTAYTDLTVISLTKPKILKLIKASAELAYSIIRTLCERVRDTDLMLADAAFKNLEGRVAAKLLHLADKFGATEKAGQITIKLPLTHQDIAELAGTSRETVTKILGFFKKEGSVSTENRKITILDRAKLTAWAER